MKKEFWLIIMLAVIFVVLLGVLILVPAKKSTQPSINGIEIISPKPNDTITLPAKITGVINGNGWAGFEGQVGHVDILFADGSTVGHFIMKATSEWTSLPTSFQADIIAPPWNEDCESANASGCATSGKANLVFHNENPSGDPAKDKTFVLPVKIK